MAGFAGAESVDTSDVMAGFGGPSAAAARELAHRDPRRLQVRRWPSPDERRSPASIRRSDQPRRPSASTCCCFSSLKTLLIPARDHASLASSTSRPLSVLAGFQVSINGRIWVSTEAL